MAILTIRNLDNELKARLRVEAAQHGRSMKEEVREILRRALRNRRLVAARAAGCASALPRWPISGWNCRARRATAVRGFLRMIVLDTNVLSELMRAQAEPPSSTGSIDRHPIPLSLPP